MRGGMRKGMSSITVWILMGILIMLFILMVMNRYIPLMKP